MATKADFVKAFKEWDGSGTGLLGDKQAKMALNEMNLPFSAQEIASHIAFGKQVSADPSGQIKLEDFALYMSYEILKKGPAKAPAQAQAQAQPQQQQAKPQQNANDNPFDMFGFDDNSNQNNNNSNGNNNSNNNNNNGGRVGVMKNKPDILVNVNNQNQNSGAYAVTVTPVQGRNNGPKNDDEKQQQLNMRDAKSPTRADDTALPDWFGHSLASPVQGNNVNQAHNDTWMDVFGFNDSSGSPSNGANGQGGANAANGNANANQQAAQRQIQNGFMTPATPNIHYAPETPGGKQKRAQTPNPNSGLIAPPQKANRSRSPKSKTRPSSPDKDGNADPFMSFGAANAQMDAAASNNNANEYDDSGAAPSGSASPNDGSKKKKKRKAKKSYEKEENDDDNASSKQKAAQPAPVKEVKKKKKRKTDAIAQMKRGTAMLKYGRHGFPHFRRFQLSRDNQRLLWYSRKKSLSETHIQIKDVKDVLEGQQTEVFKQCTQRTLKKASFSIIYGAKLKTLDVVAKSQEEAQLWTKGLKGLMKANKVGKLHKVVQILVDVPYVDITKPKGKEPTRDPGSKQQYSAELIQTIEHTLRESKKTFDVIVKLADSKHVLKSPEYDNVQILVSELEQRLNEVETGLNQKNVDFIELKRDVWVLKVDVTVLEEKLRVLSKPNSAMFL